jgi:hypothetical protein
MRFDIENAGALVLKQALEAHLVAAGDLIEGEAIGRSAAEEGKLGAQLRSAAYTGAQQQAQSAFENQQSAGRPQRNCSRALALGSGRLERPRNRRASKT